MLPGAMIDFEAVLKQKVQGLYKIASDFLGEEEARDLFRSVTKLGRGKRGLGQNPSVRPSKATERKRLARAPQFAIERELTEAD
jgi:hypothetical protein